MEANLYIHSMPTQPIFIEIETRGELPQLQEEYCFFPTLANKLRLIQEDYVIKNVYMNSNQFSSGVRKIVEEVCGIKVKGIEVDDDN